MLSVSSWKVPVFQRLLAVLLLAVAAAAQSAPLVRPVALPEGGVALLVTRIDVEGDVALSQLVMPGGSSAAPSLGGEAEPQPFGLQRFVTRYHDALGLMHLLVTDDIPDETPDQHAARHKAALDELLAEFPSAGGAEEMPPIVPGENGTQVLKTSWDGAKALKHEVITTRKTGESLDKWAERHADGVMALMKVFPPQPSGGLVLGARPRCAQAA